MSVRANQAISIFGDVNYIHQRILHDDKCVCSLLLPILFYSKSNELSRVIHLDRYRLLRFLHFVHYNRNPTFQDGIYRLSYDFGHVYIIYHKPNSGRFYLSLPVSFLHQLLIEVDGRDSWVHREQVYGNSLKICHITQNLFLTAHLSNYLQDF